MLQSRTDTYFEKGNKGRSQGRVRRSVMVSALDDRDVLAVTFTVDHVHKTMLTRNPARPAAFKLAFQRLRLSDPLEGSPACVLDQVIDSRMQVRVAGRPVEIVFPAVVRKMDPQAVASVFAGANSSRSRAPSACICRREDMRRLAFFGLLSRCTVSCQPANSSSDRTTKLPLPP